MRFGLFSHILIWTLVLMMPDTADGQRMSDGRNMEWQQWAGRGQQDEAQLTLSLLTRVQGARLGRGYHIEVFEGNQALLEFHGNGRRRHDIQLKTAALFTIRVSHPFGIPKVIQIDARNLHQAHRLECVMDLLLNTELEPLTFADSLQFDIPLSVVWFDAKRNLFRHDTNTHHDGIKQVREALAAREPFLPAP